MQNLRTMNGDKSTGSFYTPQDIAGYIAERTIEAYLDHVTNHPLLTIGPNRRNINADVLQDLINRVKILDPAVGEGVFLLAAGEKLLELRQKYGDTRKTCTIKKQIVKNNLFGVDLLSLPVEKTQKLLLNWCKLDHGDVQSEIHESLQQNIKQGNSLIGNLNSNEESTEPLSPETSKPPINAFDWNTEFPAVFETQENGFDVIIANPPYGNILGKEEKQLILDSYPLNITSGRNGSWNIACLFVVRCAMLLSNNGHMGLILPNSLLRVGQFQKIRKFIFNRLHPWEIVDEGKAWDDVTLEMVSIFCSKQPQENSYLLEILSRRKGLEGRHWIPSGKIDPSGIIPLYHDDFFENLLERAVTGVLSGSRGKDIPSKHLRNERLGEFVVPFATKGRSIGQYHLVSKWMKYTDEWYKTSKRHEREIEEEFLIATKNLPYPRCVMKPKGYLHGGGVVRISINNSAYQPEAVGLILNSRIARYISVRYLTNYSKYTTCMNTGILDQFPLIYPDESAVYTTLFRRMQQLRFEENGRWNVSKLLEKVANALVYAEYLNIHSELNHEMVSVIQNAKDRRYEYLISELQQASVEEPVNRILHHPEVLEIESSPALD